MLNMQTRTTNTSTDKYPVLSMGTHGGCVMCDPYFLDGCANIFCPKFRVFRASIAVYVWVFSFPLRVGVWVWVSVAICSFLIILKLITLFVVSVPFAVKLPFVSLFLTTFLLLRCVCCFCCCFYFIFLIFLNVFFIFLQLLVGFGVW